ncbi:hypothetical protein DdX_11895 [Ditylenchus destructor]|uniref:HTH psq-type domain-containing protein n=1 Tax=Ditylenchus destructor TaxID=166010 RepID=A0AAD4R418_9BILA|nr:hypothetical protein DdX_11895 [Ditylenchus destructor]
MTCFVSQIMVIISIAASVGARQVFIYINEESLEKNHRIAKVEPRSMNDFFTIDEEESKGSIAKALGIPESQIKRIEKRTEKKRASPDGPEMETLIVKSSKE